MCIFMDRKNSNGVEDYSPEEMFDLPSLSTLSKQFLLRGVQKFLTIWKISTNVLIFLDQNLCTHTDPEQCYHLIFHLTISKDLTKFKKPSIFSTSALGDGKIQGRGIIPVSPSFPCTTRMLHFFSLVKGVNSLQGKHTTFSILLFHF